MQTYYDILGLPFTATKAEIRAAYKALALKYHPDRNFGDPDKEELFKQINQAYQTLYNDYSRSRYDMLLRYSREQPVQTKNYQPPRAYRYPPQPRPPVSVTSRENLRATAYAFLFALGIALIIKTGIFAYEAYQEKQRSELLAQRRELFTKVRSQRTEGQLVESLHMLSAMGYFYAEERDMSEFKKDLLREIKTKGDEYLEAKKYGKALEMYEQLKEHAIGHSVDQMKKLAFAYKGMGRIKEAIDIYRTLHLYGYESMDFYYEMGQLYEEGAKNPEQALKYYKISAEKAAASYEITLGKAYPVLISADFIPERHYHVYMKVAQMHLAVGQYQKALDGISWTKEMWPDSLYQYHIWAQSLKQMGRTAESDSVVRRARAIDPHFELQSMDRIILSSAK